MYIMTFFPEGRLVVIDRPISDTSKVRVFYESRELRDSALDKLEAGESVLQDAPGFDGIDNLRQRTVIANELVHPDTSVAEFRRLYADSIGSDGRPTTGDEIYIWGDQIRKLNAEDVLSSLSGTKDSSLKCDTMASFAANLTPRPNLDLEGDRCGFDTVLQMIDTANMESLWYRLP